MRKHRCADCRFYRKVERQYYGECDAGPMATRPKDPKCMFFKQRKEKYYVRQRNETLG